MAEPRRLARGFRAGSTIAALLALGACSIEDRTPKGSRRDQSEIQDLIYAYHRAQRADPSGDPNPRDMRVVRLDVRQEGDLAAAWVGARLPGGRADTDVIEHFVLRRDGGTWRVVNVAVARRGPQPSPGGP